MLAVEVDLARVESGDVHLYPGELLLGRLAALTSLLDLARQAIQLRGAGLHARPDGIDLSRQSGQALATVCCRTLDRGHALLLRRRRRLRRDAFGLRLRQGLTRGLHESPQLELLGAQDAGLGVDLVGVATVVVLLRLRLQVPDTLGGDLRQPVESLAQSVQREPRLLDRRHTRRIGLCLGLGKGLTVMQIGQLGVDLVLPLP